MATSSERLSGGFSPAHGAGVEAPADESVSASHLIARVQTGERVRAAEVRSLCLGDQLLVRRAEREQLEAMSAVERTSAYRAGELSSYQLVVWNSRYPREIPRIDDVPEWLAVTLVDVCEHPDYETRCRQTRAARLAGQPL